MLNMCRAEYVLALEVITGKNLAVPSGRTPTGLYVLVTTPYGYWNTAVMAPRADCSVSWNETLNIRGRPLMFPRCFMPFFSSTSKTVHLEIRAKFECEPMLGRGELVGTVEMSLKELLAHDEQFVSLPAVNSQCTSLVLKARRVKIAAHRDLGLTSIPGPEHGQPAPPAPNISLNNKTRSRARNVVIFGESGSGKSSVINAIAQKKLAKTSGDAAGCTSRHQRYKVNISGQEYALFDTVGFDEGTEGTVPAAQAKKGLKGLLAKLTSPGSDGIDLLVYCVQSTRARRALVRNYNHVYSTICRKKVPIVVVVTGLENEPVIGNWWNTYGKEFESLGMPFKDHACVTTLVEDTGASDDLIHRIAESRKVLRRLIVENCSE